MSHNLDKRPKVGVAVIVVKEHCLLLGKRRNSHGAGQWAPPGGHLEYGETVEECARRELEEETGIKAKSIIQGPWVSDIIGEDKHYITLFTLVTDSEGEPVLKEPEKCEEWCWIPYENLPQPLFAPLSSLIKQKGTSFFESGTESSSAIESLKFDLERFFNERDWDQFHSPKNLLMNLASEMGELMEHFRWLTEKQSYNLEPHILAEVKDEIGDVCNTLLAFCKKLGIDPIEAGKSKLQKLHLKYPVEVSKGKNLKYTAYQKSEDKSIIS